MTPATEKERLVELVAMTLATNYERNNRDCLGRGKKSERIKALIPQFRDDAYAVLDAIESYIPLAPKAEEGVEKLVNDLQRCAIVFQASSPEDENAAVDKLIEAKKRLLAAYRPVASHASTTSAVVSQDDDEVRDKSMLDPDMSAQELRLHMGELTAQEERTARAAIRWANASAEVQKPTALPDVTDTDVSKIGGYVSITEAENIRLRADLDATVEALIEVRYENAITEAVCGKALQRIGRA